MRSDIPMGVGKVASQAGHAFIESFLASPISIQQDYRADGMGTKVVLSGSLDQILRAHHEAKAKGIPCALITDSGCPNFFNGEPTITALGIGPALRSDVYAITKRLRLL